MRLLPATYGGTDLGIIFPGTAVPVAARFGWAGELPKASQHREGAYFPSFRSLVALSREASWRAWMRSWTPSLE